MSSKNMAAVRLRRVAAGLCPQCGERPPEAGRKRCRLCLDYNAKFERNRYVGTPLPQMRK